MRLPLTLRRATSRLLRRIPVRIRAGPNRGMRWSLAAAGRGFWSGRFERDRAEALSALLRRGDHVWDAGAHQGYVTLLAARRVRPGGRVVAIEPSSYNRWYLERHAAWNGLEDVRVAPVALAGRDGRRRFRESGSSVAFRLGGDEGESGGEGEVVARTPRSLAGEVGRPTFVKLDVEGAESEVLGGVLDLLPSDGAVVVALHSREADRRARSALAARGFRVLPSRRLRRFRDRRGRRGWPGDPDVVGLGPEREVDGGELRRLAYFGRGTAE